MKISAITVNAPSTFFRLTQYLPLLKKEGIVLTEDADPDLVFVQKKLLPLPQERSIRHKARRLLFDFDDAIWTRPGKPYSWITSWRVKTRLHYWLKQADIVTCSSTFLANYAKPFAEPHIIPMTLDTNLWKPVERAPNAVITVGWAGAPHNLHHLERLGPILKDLPLKLHVFSGKKPQLPFPFVYFPYDEQQQISFIQQLDIGLLPLSCEEYSCGKSPIKAVQYIACGVPVVGNIYGASADILQETFSLQIKSDRDWAPAIKKLASEANLRQAMAQKARAFAEASHSLQAGAKALINLLKG